MGLVQNMAVLSSRELRTEGSEGASFWSARQQVDRIDDKLVCPMPCRLGTVSFTSGESMKPFRQRRSVLPATLDCEASHEIMEIFCRKNTCVMSTNFGCSPPYFSGSPPCRASNPIVSDAEFSRQRRSVLPASSMLATITRPVMQCNTTTHHVESSIKRPSSPLPSANMQSKSVTTIPTYRGSPCVRVEGFECPSRAFECTSHDTRCPASVSVIA